MKTVVGVLRGGPSSEYEISLQSGANVLSSLDAEKYEARDIFIDRSGEWHVRGVPTPPERALMDVDVCFNVLHGAYGESGEVQKILELNGTPYSGSGTYASSLAFNKHATKEIVKERDVKVARDIVLDEGADAEQAALEIFRTFPHPAIVKPMVGGSSIGITLADSYHALLDGIEKAREHSPKVLIEEFIKGKEATVGIIEDFRGEKIYALMPVEIVPPPRHAFFNYDAKYSGESIERVPGNFTDSEKKQLIELAKLVHTAMDADHYSRSDFIISKRGIYFLEMNSAAAVGLSSQSIFPKAIEAVGAKMSDFTSHIISLALNERRG